MWILLFFAASDWGYPDTALDGLARSDLTCNRGGVLMSRCNDNFLNIFNLFVLYLSRVFYFIFRIFCQLRLILGIIIERWETSLSQVYKFLPLRLKLVLMRKRYLWSNLIFENALNLSSVFVSWWMLDVLGLMTLTVLSIIADVLRFLSVLSIA